MKIAIITHVSHFLSNGQYFAYSPYVREMNIWIKSATQVIIVAPSERRAPTVIDIAYNHKQIDFNKIPSFNLLGFADVMKSLLLLPGICISIFKAMHNADHIHLRCPGNVGLIGCFIQILFPGKPKTAKYAGNWDPSAKQPWSYKLQKWILNNTVLTKNMQVLVYGHWAGNSNNIKPFFTASYHQSDAVATVPREPTQNIKCLFVGTLSTGKRPLYAVKLIHELRRHHLGISIDMYGEGVERAAIQQYIDQHNLGNAVTILGNATADVVRDAYQNAHFLILPSVSEGWPKVVAEAMFWGCVPLASAVSCVPMMLGKGDRGLVLAMDLQYDVAAVSALISNPEFYKKTALNAMEWSRHYTLELFESEIGLLLTR